MLHSQNFYNNFTINPMWYAFTDSNLRSIGPPCLQKIAYMHLPEIIIC